MTLKLPCGVEIPVLSHLLPPASPFFRDVLEDVTGSAAIPVSRIRTRGIAVIGRIAGIAGIPG
jgi:hypothetical protein